MSFSITFKVPAGMAAVGGVEEAFQTADIPNKDFIVTAAGDILPVAFDLADNMAAEVADASEAVQVSISGHWNGSLAPKPGWASNALTISVTQIYNPES
jgi:hypothetical protein